MITSGSRNLECPSHFKRSAYSRKDSSDSQISLPGRSAWSNRLVPDKCLAIPTPVALALYGATALTHARL